MELLPKNTEKPDYYQPLINYPCWQTDC